jgi:hypothetical protein
MTAVAGFVVLEWLDSLPLLPRYSFSTIVHARELGESVRWVTPCATLEAAAALAARLNTPMAQSRA